MNTELANGAVEQVLNGIRIPPCPEVLISTMNKMNNPKSELTDIARSIQQDAGVVAPLLKLVNSPLFGLGGEITSIYQAISVLGLRSTISLLQNVVLRQSLAGSLPKFEKFWERSGLTAKIASELALRIPGVSPDDAYIAALFHDCGIPVLIQKYPDYRETVMSMGKAGKAISDVENDCYATSHAAVGSLLGRTWFLPSHVCKAILYHHDPTIFSSPGEHASTDARNLIGLIHMSEYIADEHLLHPNQEWDMFKREVLAFFEMSEQEFLELKGDTLALLSLAAGHA